MKKATVLACVVLFFGAVYAQEELDLETIKENAKTIIFTMTISRDDTYNEKAWGETVDSAMKALQVALDSEQKEATNDEAIDATLRAIKETYDLCSWENGIDGNLSIELDNIGKDDCSFDDEEFTKGGCGAVCEDCKECDADCDTRGCDGVCGGDDNNDKRGCDGACGGDDKNDK